MITSLSRHPPSRHPLVSLEDNRKLERTSTTEEENFFFFSFQCHGEIYISFVPQETHSTTFSNVPEFFQYCRYHLHGSHIAPNPLRRDCSILFFTRSVCKGCLVCLILFFFFLGIAYPYLGQQRMGNVSSQKVSELGYADGAFIGPVSALLRQESQSRVILSMESMVVFPPTVDSILPIVVFVVSRQFLYIPPCYLIFHSGFDSNSP